MERGGMFNSRVPNINQATGTSKQTGRETVWNRDTKWNGNRDNNGGAIRSNKSSNRNNFHFMRTTENDRSRLPVDGKSSVFTLGILSSEGEKE